MFSAPLIESLEDRRLLNGALATGDVAATPDLIPTLVGGLPTLVLAGAKIKSKVLIQNAGAAMSAPSKVAVDAYLSDSDTLAEGTPAFQHTSVQLRLRSGQSKSVGVRLTAPSELPDAGYHILFRVNADGVVAEQDAGNNVIATSFLSNPYGHYRGTINVQSGSAFGGQATVPFEFDLTPVAGKVGRFSTPFAFQDQDVLGDMELSLSGSLSSTGRLKISAKGSAPSAQLGAVTFSLSFSGQISAHTFSGGFSLRGKSSTMGAFSARASFQMSKVS